MARPLRNRGTSHAVGLSRLGRLPPAKAVAQLGAVSGPEFDRGMLTAIAGMWPESLRGGLDQLLAAGLLFARGSGSEIVYTSKHALIQNAAYGSLTRRQSVHNAIAPTLAGQNSDVRPEFIARHFVALMVALRQRTRSTRNACAGYPSKI